MLAKSALACVVAAPALARWRDGVCAAAVTPFVLARAARRAPRARLCDARPQTP